MEIKNYKTRLEELDEMIEENRSKMAASLSIEEYDLVRDRIRLEIEKALLERGMK